MAFPFLPVLGGLGLLYFFTRKSEEPAISIDKVYGAVTVNAPPPNLVEGKLYAVVLRFLGGKTPSERGDIWVEAKCVKASEKGEMGEFVIDKLLERFTPRQTAEPDVAAALRAGKRLSFSAAFTQVTAL